MMAWWTQLLPVFIFKRLAQQCGVVSLRVDSGTMPARTSWSGTRSP